MKKFRKPYRVKRKKSIFRNRFFWLGILAFVFAGSAFYFFLFSEIFQVEKIIITGEKKVSTEDLKLLVEGKLESKILFFSTKSVFAVDLGEMRKDILNNFPQIAEIEIGRGFPDSLNIAVIERLSLAIWCQEDQCFLLDNEGIIFEKFVDEPRQMKIQDSSLQRELQLGKRVIEKELLDQILGIKSKLWENLEISIAEASILPDGRLNTKTSEGWEIYLNLKGDLDWQITELGLVLVKQIPPEKRGELEYIDMRFSRVYYKYKK